MVVLVEEVVALQALQELQELVVQETLQVQHQVKEIMVVLGEQCYYVMVEVVEVEVLVLLEVNGTNSQ
jgi:hypothetical protein